MEHVRSQLSQVPVLRFVVIVVVPVDTVLETILFALRRQFLDLINEKAFELIPSNLLVSRYLGVVYEHL